MHLSSQPLGRLRSRGPQFQGSPTKSSRNSVSKEKGRHGGMHLSSQLWQKESQSRLTKAKRKTISKITKAKRARGITQAVEHQPSKCEALNLNSSTEKKILKRGRETQTRVPALSYQMKPYVMLTMQQGGPLQMLRRCQTISQIYLLSV
jgi:hypothetical protein